ncbi:MAG: ABC transporter ATP-binding protein [Candidatus Riflebacteria bacterium]|nr:ABC transporter ATP-binding protein [Candidatus Riflebacteria bacterium]
MSNETSNAASASSEVILGKGLKRYYKRGIETVKALDGVDISIKSGEMVSILGPSGSGKTTLINLLSGLDAPDEGSLFIGGKQVNNLNEDSLVSIRRGIIGFIFQKFHLIPTLSVEENIELPLMFLERSVNKDRISEILKQVGLEDRRSHLPRELSGGQMQRVAIARALIADPKVLIADEPTGNLDRANSDSVFALFRQLKTVHNLAIVITTHNLHLGGQADRIITLEDGKIAEEVINKQAF